MMNTCNPLRKGIFVITVMLCMGAINAQASLTFDVENLLQMIKEYEMMVTQTQTAITSLQYQYEATVNQAKAMQKLDYADIDSFRDAVSVANQGLSFLRNTENYLTRQRFQFGNNSYTLTEMYNVPGGALSTMVVAATADMTAAQKAAVWHYYGLDPANYYYTQLWKKRITDVGKQLVAMSVQTEELSQKQLNANEELANAAQNTDSSVALQQISIGLLKNVADGMATLGLGTAKIGEQIAAIAELSNYEEARKPAVSDDFMNSLDKK